MLARIRMPLPWIGMALLLATLAIPDPCPAMAAEADQTLSPYFFVRSDDPETDRLPLKKTEARIRIAGMAADVTVTQVYKNEGKKPLEAIYVFPASTRAAVHAMKMTVGSRVIVAEIMKRGQARETYEQARQEGRTASLLEQQRPNVFQMNVANILPGDEIQVELRYFELLRPVERVYEFAYPAVVGPRYSTTPAAGAPDTEKWTHNPYLHQDQPAPYRFGLQVDLAAGADITGLTCPSHDIDTRYDGRNRVRVALKEDARAGTRDFVLRYKLAGGRIESGLLLYPGTEENHFLLMMEPPDRVRPESTLPREYIFIVDVSGSMNGFPLDVSKSLMKAVIDDLGPRDFINVLLFAGGSEVLSQAGSLPADPANKAKAWRFVQSQRGGGGTEILPALRRALDLPRTEGVSRVVVVLTDGFISVEPQVFETIRARLGEASLFAFGIGRSVNRHLIEGMARAGQGEPFVVLDQAQAPIMAERFRQYVRSPVLTGIRLTFDGFEAEEVEPPAVPDLFAQRPIVVMGKYKGPARGRITVSGRTASGTFEKTMALADGLLSPDNQVLRLLWARHRIMRLSDMNSLAGDDHRIEEVTELGLKYGLMTQYTSFVAVDKVRRADGELVTVRQPLPLPSGVSDLAVGDRIKRSAAVGMMKHQAAFSEQSAENPRPAILAPGNGSKDGSGSARDEEKTAGRDSGPTLTVDEVRGRLERSAVEKRLRDEIKAMAACLAGATAAPGQAVYRFVIDESGRVAEIRVVSTSMTDPALADCIRKVIESIRFDRPDAGRATVTVRISSN